MCRSGESCLACEKPTILLEMEIREHVPFPIVSIDINRQLIVVQAAPREFWDFRTKALQDAVLSQFHFSLQKPNC